MGGLCNNSFQGPQANEIDYRQVDPTFRETPYKFFTPGQDMINELFRMISQSSGNSFGGKGLFGSGIMNDDIIKRLTQAATQATQFAPTGQWMSPQMLQKNQPQQGGGFGIGFGGLNLGF